MNGTRRTGSLIWRDRSLIWPQTSALIFMNVLKKAVLCISFAQSISKDEPYNHPPVRIPVSDEAMWSAVHEVHWEWLILAWGTIRCSQVVLGGTAFMEFPLTSSWNELILNDETAVNLIWIELLSALSCFKEMLNLAIEGTLTTCLAVFLYYFKSYIWPHKTLRFNYAATLRSGKSSFLLQYICFYTAVILRNSRELRPSTSCQLQTTTSYRCLLLDPKCSLKTVQVRLKIDIVFHLDLYNPRGNR